MAHLPTKSQKRKESSQDSLPTPSKRPRNDNPGRCHFLELPRELRDQIYNCVLALEGDITIKQRKFITKSSLVGVNAQIGEEFLDAVFFHAPVIHTTVRNHNFAHVVTFINSLSEAQIARFKTGSHSGSKFEDAKFQSRLPPRKICITLTYSPTKMSTKAQLNRWLDRFDDPDRRGAELDFEYVLDFDSWQHGGYKQRPRGRAREGPGASRESGKIMAACRRGQRGCWY